MKKREKKEMTEDKANIIDKIKQISKKTADDVKNIGTKVRPMAKKTDEAEMPEETVNPEEAINVNEVINTDRSKTAPGIKAKSIVKGAGSVIKRIIEKIKAMLKERSLKKTASEAKSKAESRFEKMIKNAPIRKKLTVSHGIIIVFTFILTVVLLTALKGVEGYVKDMYSGPVTNSFYIGDFRYALADIPSVINQVRIHAQGSEVTEYVDQLVADARIDIDKDLAMMDNAYTILSKSLSSEESKEMLEKISSLMANVKRELETMFTLMESGDVNSGGYYYEGNIKRWLEAINTDVEQLTQDISEISIEYRDRASRVALILILIGVLMLVVVVLAALQVTRKVTAMISEPLLEVTEAARKMSQGDMDAYTEIEHQSEDEVGVLADAMRDTMKTMEDYIKEISGILEQMAYGDLTKDFEEIMDFHGDFATIKESFVFILTEFNKTLASINQVSEQVDRDADDVAAAASELAAGTDEQASAVEELTATINSVAGIALENAKQAEQSYQGVMVSVQEAQQKRAQVEELQAEMQRIKDISGEIAKIITTIEDIAAETRLLSLNASIEAARAGAAGRGFAVVADHIGKLAAGSANAAVSTKNLIQKTVAEIDKGNAITESTADAFDSIIKEMMNFADTAQNSKETAEEQATILKQLEDGVNEVAAVTQENAALAEESLSTSEKLAKRADELAEQVNRFKLH